MYELIILCRLMVQPSHGYLIGQILNDMIGPYAKVSNGRLYPLLAKLEEQGLIVAYEDAGETHGGRKVRSYAITEAGRKRWHALMMDTTSNPGEYNKFFLSKSPYLRLLSSTDRIILLDHYIHYSEAHVIHLKAEGEGLRNLPPGIEETDYLNAALNTLDHMVAQWQLELAWGRSLHEHKLAEAAMALFEPEGITMSQNQNGAARAMRSAPKPIIALNSALHRLLLSCGIIGSLLFNAVYLIAGAIRPGYDPWRQPMSALSLSDGGWIQGANFIVFGLFIICFAIGLRVSLRPGAAATWGPILQVQVALGLILAGIFTQDSDHGYPPRATLLTTPTTHAVIHLFATFLAFGSRVIWCFVIARRFAIEPRWRGWATYAVVTGILMVIFLATFGAEMSSNGPAGLFEKLATMVTSLLTILLAARLLSGTGFSHQGNG